MTDQNDAGGTGSDNAGGTGTELTFDAWVQSQDDKIKGLLEGHTSGLKTALVSEREARKALEKQLKDLAGKAEKGSELEKQLADLANQSAQNTERAEFYEAAHGAGVSNLKLAYAIAREEGLIDAKGRVDFDEMRKAFPELFKSTQRSSGNAGSGTNNSASDKISMDDFIRRKVIR
jgi:hypothetical protein